MSLVIFPRQFLVDINGTPRVGAKANFYQSGTTTPITVYTTGAYSAPHANPVLSVSGGLFPAVYVNPTVNSTYKMVITDSADVTLYTEDNIPALGFTEDDIGAILYRRTDAEIAATVTPTNYSYPPGDIRRYGTTDPSGVASSNTAIKNAVAVARLSKGKVFAPLGRWRFTETILIDNSMTLEGEDTDGTVLLKDGNFIGITIDTAAGNSAQPTLRNFTLDRTGGSDAAVGIRVNEYRAHISQVTVQNQGSHGIECVNSNLSYLCDLKLLSNGGDGLKINGAATPDANAMTIINIDSRANTGWGINVNNGWANFIKFSQTSFNTAGGLRLNNARSNMIELYSEANTGPECELVDNADCAGNFIILNEGAPAFGGTTAQRNTVMRNQRGSVFDSNFNKLTSDKFIIPNTLQGGSSVVGALTIDHTVDNMYDVTSAGGGQFARVRFRNTESPGILSVETDGSLIATAGVLPSGDTGPLWTTGSGSPEGVVAAPVGSLYTSTGGGASTTLYVKTGGGGGTTGWTAK